MPGSLGLPAPGRIEPPVKRLALALLDRAKLTILDRQGRPVVLRNKPSGG